MTETDAPLAPLSADEQAAFEKLLVRASAGKSPGTRIGDAYEALTCLSVPRRGDKDRQTDLVHAGETVYLTEEEARQFMRRDPGRDGRQVPVIRKLSGPDGSRDPLPGLLPRHLSGRLFRPPVPPPGSDAARPDPAESSRIQVLDEGRAPEVSGSAAAEPQEMADQLRTSPQQDAVDLPPRHRTRTRGGQRADG